jgi:hypothetical protein
MNLKASNCSKSSLPELPQNINAHTLTLNNFEDNIHAIKVRKIESIAKVRKNLAEKS